jgi:molybdopterin converting factor small subunit
MHAMTGEQSTPTGEQSTPDVRVTFMGELPSIIGTRSLQVALPEGATVGELLAALSARYGDAFTDRIFSGPAKLEHTMLIFVDGENIKERGGLAATLGTGEVEVIMLPMLGGG